MVRKLSKNFFSFPKKRIFFLWILSLWAPSIFSFDSHEHVYLGECLELKYEGDDSNYKEASLYKKAYEKIAAHNKLSGTLCDKVKGNDVYRIKLNQFNFKDHETLKNPYTFEVYRKNSKWNDLPYTSSAEYIPIYRISTTGKLKELDTNELKEIANKKNKCTIPTKTDDKWEEKRIFKNLDKNSFYKKNVEGKENTWAQKFGTVYEVNEINIVTESNDKLRDNNNSLKVVVWQRNNEKIAILIPSKKTNNFKEFRVQTLNDLWSYLGQNTDKLDSSKYKVHIPKVKEDTWSIGEIISIAGDYIGLTVKDGKHPTKAPAISDPLFEDLTTAADLNEEELRKRLEKVAQNVLRAFNYLKKWSGNPFLPSGFPDKDLTTWFREDIVKKELMDVASIHEATKTKVTFDSSSHRQKYVTGKRALHQAASQLTIKSHDNLALLSANVDHFAPDAQYVYQVGHNLACSFAMSAKNSFKEKKILILLTKSSAKRMG